MHDVARTFRLGGRVAVVTGAASGIGRAAAEVLASAGARVLLGDVDASGGSDVAAGIREEGGEASSARVDVAQREEVEALVSRALSEWGRLDVMANVAGIPGDGSLSDLDEAELERVFAVNVKGTLFGCQAAARAMATGAGGSIVNISSAAIDVPAAGIGLYAMTKAAVAQLTRTMAVELGAQGIRVNALAPGVTITKFTERHLRGDDGRVDPDRYDSFVEAMRARSPLDRVGDALDQAWLILYLASDASRFCTGQIWRANGGAAMP